MNKIIDLDISDREASAIESVVPFSLTDRTVEISVEYDLQDGGAHGMIVEIYEVTMLRGDGAYDLADGPCSEIWDRLYSKIEEEP